jgi:hypothetical protein
MPMGPKPQGGMGATVGIIIIILVLAAGGLYLWFTKAAPVPSDNTQTTAQVDEAQPEAASDTASALEAALEASDSTAGASSDLDVR